ncbi:30S ribosomal protein S1 [Bacillus sp. CRN 9]|nr:30S ribosomal protein S1 [Bacillus sp. CRN 9]
MSSDVLNVLIEGFDPDKIQEQEAVDSKWREIQGAYQNNTILTGELVGFEALKLNEGKELCGVVRIGSIKGLIPLMESGIDNNDKQAINKFRALSGKKIAFNVLQYSKDNNLFIASRKKARDQMMEVTLRKIDVGYNIYCVAREVEQGHIIGDIGGIDVHIPVFELTYGWVDDLRDFYKAGDHIKVQVVNIDNENKEVKVSAKPLLQNPFPDCATRYIKNGEYVGTVSGVQNYGIFVNLEEGVDSLAPHLKFQNVQKGDKVLVRVIGVDIEKEQVRSKIIRVL